MWFFYNSGILIHMKKIISIRIRTIAFVCMGSMITSIYGFSAIAAIRTVKKIIPAIIENTTPIESIQTSLPILDVQINSNIDTVSIQSQVPIIDAPIFKAVDLTVIPNDIQIDASKIQNTEVQTSMPVDIVQVYKQSPLSEVQVIKNTDAISKIIQINEPEKIKKIDTAVIETQKKDTVAPVKNIFTKKIQKTIKTAKALFGKKMLKKSTKIKVDTNPHYFGVTINNLMTTDKRQDIYRILTYMIGPKGETLYNLDEGPHSTNNPIYQRDYPQIYSNSIIVISTFWVQKENDPSRYTDDCVNAHTQLQSVEGTFRDVRVHTLMTHLSTVYDDVIRKTAYMCTRTFWVK